MPRNRIALVGTGSMGSAITEALVKRTSHDVFVRGSKFGYASATALSQRLGVRQAAEADITQSDFAFVAIPALAIEQVAALLKDFTCVVISVTVDENVGFDGNKSSAQQLGDLLSGVRVVGAFSSLYDVVVRDPEPSERQVFSYFRTAMMPKLLSSRLLRKWDSSSLMVVPCG
ncbi:coenzyme F420-dependent NADP oxidoreductase-like protein [Paraburkholderia sp. BL27I4N3]|uniref:NAD(P)-binding domain-containing protein n=1 Tax=Paraburkholderia sp. BL27I4N3 TaxID=1938805 RepID=UPI000E2217B9|nr:NAD(P)-binding domain-containing protein [Paraburkholderia sp. BL27I4N3]REE07500.1 coenzyme F420-dependent NADP oxidoreductase-like protein [Paraburkholderia sp. BL27I4N3]